MSSGITNTQHGTVTGSAKRRSKSRHKQSAIRHNCGIAAWRLAAAEHLKKGKFVHLPKRGTPEHAAMRIRQRELLPAVRAQIQRDEKIALEARNAERKKRNKAMQARAMANYARQQALDLAAAEQAKISIESTDEPTPPNTTPLHTLATREAGGVQETISPTTLTPHTSDDESMGVEVVEDWI